jgi:adenylyl-sulfate kinase
MEATPGFVIWLYGLPCSGKSTLANSLIHWARQEGYPALGLDGDLLRSGVCADLGFSDEDRTENVRRTSHLAKLAMDSGFATIVSLVTPTVTLRELAMNIIPAERLLLVAVTCPIQECKRRDVKGMYAKAAAGLMKGMTGVDGVFDPVRPGEFEVNSLNQSIEECKQSIIDEALLKKLL